MFFLLPLIFFSFRFFALHSSPPCQVWLSTRECFHLLSSYGKFSYIFCRQKLLARRLPRTQPLAFAAKCIQSSIVERSSHCSAAIQRQQWCCSKNKCFAKEKRVAAFLEWPFFMFSSPALSKKWCHQASTATTITIKSHRHSLNKKPQTDERIWNKRWKVRWLHCCFQWPFSHGLLGVSSFLLKNGHFIRFYFKPLERLSPPFCGWSGTFHDACISTNSPLSMSIFFFLHLSGGRAVARCCICVRLSASPRSRCCHCRIGVACSFCLAGHTVGFALPPTL